MTLHEELEAELAASRAPRPSSRSSRGFTANTGVIPTITGEADLIVSDALNHASIIDGMRLSKAPRKVYPHEDVAALREVLREAREHGRPRRRRPYRLILVVTDGVFSHGRRHRAAARRSWRRPRSTARRSWSTTPTPRACSAGTAAARSTTSGCTAGSRSRSARCPRRSASSAATWPARRTCARSSSSARGRSSSRRPTRRPSRPPAARRSGSWRTSLS